MAQAKQWVVECAGGCSEAHDNRDRARRRRDSKNAPWRASLLKKAGPGGAATFPMCFDRHWLAGQKVPE